MKRLSLWFALFSVYGLGISLSGQELRREALVILHVTVIDATGVDAMPDQTVVITGGRISAISSNTETLVSAMRGAGVKFMAGTDAPNPFVIPGQSLHDELELLVQAGFTPMEALQSATRNPAEYLGRLDTLGTVEQGKIADLLLLDGNPLEDINNTRKILAIILRGKLLTKPTLEEMSLKGAAFVEALRVSGVSKR
jgi:imidazolonepropionase-like amidohydrolase